MYPDYKGKRVVCGCTHEWQITTRDLRINTMIGLSRCPICDQYPWIYLKRGAFIKYKRS